MVLVLFGDLFGNPLKLFGLGVLDAPGYTFHAANKMYFAPFLHVDTGFQ